MAKKKKLESMAPVPLTRGQLSRAAREKQQIRNLYTAGIAIGTLVLLVLGFAVVYSYIVKPNAQVASVNGQNINRATYDKLRRWNLFQQIQSTAFQQQFSQQTGQSGQAGSTVGNGQLDALVQQLKSVSSETTLDQQTIQTLVDNEVVRQKSVADFSINPTTDEIKAAAIKNFVPSPTPPPSSETPTEAVISPTVAVTGTATMTSTITPSATSTRTPTATATRGSPTRTPTSTATLAPVPGAQATAETQYSQFVSAIKNGPNAQQTGGFCGYGCPSLSESDYLTLLIEPSVRKDKVTEKLATGIITEVEQIRVQHILTTTLDGAKQIRARLDKGEDFTKLALEQSSDTAVKQNQGIYDWFPRDPDINGLVPQFVEGAWPVKVGEYSQPVQSQFGWHIIKVLERDPKRPLTQDQIDKKKTKLYDDWFMKAKAGSSISPSFAQQQPTPTAPPLVEPTAPPLNNPTPTQTPGPGQAVTGTIKSNIAPPTPTVTSGSSGATAPTSTKSP